MNVESERRMNERRDRLLNIVKSLQDEIARLEFQNAELSLRDQQRVAIINEQSEEIKRLSEQVKQLKRDIAFKSYY